MEAQRMEDWRLEANSMEEMGGGEEDQRMDRRGGRSEGWKRER
jgi:hypothetical protein